MAAGRVRVADQVAGLRHRHEIGRYGRMMVEELWRNRGGKMTCRGRNFDAFVGFSCCWVVLESEDCGCLGRFQNCS